MQRRYAVDESAEHVPAWTTLREAAYLARVSSEHLRAWAEAGAISAVPWPSKGDPITTLFRTEDVYRVAASPPPPTPNFVFEPPEVTASVGGHRLTRRSALAALGAMVATGAVSMTAVAQMGSRGDVEPIEAASTTVASKERTTGTKHAANESGSTTSTATSGTTSVTQDRGGGGRPHGSRAPVIDSISVVPDPVSPDGTATITIDASPKGRIATYSLTVSEGVVIQDPGSPGLWTWRLA